jgi:hypothetical protein
MVARIDGDVIPAAFAAGMEGGSDVPTLRADGEADDGSGEDEQREAVHAHECSPRKPYSLGLKSS